MSAKRKFRFNGRYVWDVLDVEIEAENQEDATRQLENQAGGRIEAEDLECEDLGEAEE